MHPAFVEQVERLLTAVEADRKRGDSRSANAKLLDAIARLAFDEIPRDPARKEFRQGQTLGENRKHWFRAKFGGGRFRLFFRYRTDVRLILYAWVNDENSLRTYGSRTDAYAVFGRMLDDGNPPDEWDQLLADATSAEVRSRTARIASRLADR